jgi:hypothetical protein
MNNPNLQSHPQIVLLLRDCPANQANAKNQSLWQRVPVTTPERTTENRLTKKRHDCLTAGIGHYQLKWNISTMSVKQNPIPESLNKNQITMIK